MKEMREFHSVGKVGEIAPGGSKVVEVGGKQIAVFNLDGTYRALDNICPHRGGPLGEGFIAGDEIACPWHAWSFDVRTGCSSIDPSLAVEVFEVRIEDGEIKIGV